MDKLLARLNKLQAEKTKTVSAFATATGCSQATISRQLKGEMQLSLKTLLSVLDVYKDVSAEWLMRGEGSMYIADNTPADMPTSIPEQIQSSKEEIDHEFMMGMMNNLIAQNKLIMDKLMRMDKKQQNV